MKILTMTNGLCGIDEAGRGPFAGPMVVAGVKLHKQIDELNDSKKLTEKKREKLYDIIINNSNYHIVFSSAKDIDTLGISTCIKNSIIEIMNNIEAKQYLMDGNTVYNIPNISCKIKADASVSEVAAASILAKVSRDRFMIEISKKYPLYNFEKHKGYGTKAHTQAIIKHGLCDIHRKSFKIKALENRN
jgi:ribonuclease HII